MRWVGHVTRIRERGDYRFSCRYLKEINHLENLGVDRTLTKILKKSVGRGVYRIDMALDRDKWRAVVNTVINLRVP
jgi:hypothetical protein